MTESETPKKQTSGLKKNLLFQKVAIFVDAENIEMSSLKHHEARTDYKKILDQVGDREIIRILYYKPAYKEISADFEGFWASLGGEIRRPTKNADTFLVIDAVTMAEKIDVAIILGGDKDFLPLIWYLRSRGCRVEIWSWPETTSPEMKEGSDFYFPLTEEYVLAGKTPARRASSGGGSGSGEGGSGGGRSGSGSGSGGNRGGGGRGGGSSRGGGGGRGSGSGAGGGRGSGSGSSGGSNSGSGRSSGGGASLGGRQAFPEDRGGYNHNFDHHGHGD